MANWTKRGGSLKVIIMVLVHNMILEFPHYWADSNESIGWGYIYTSGLNDANIAFEFSGLTLPIPSHAKYAPYVIYRGQSTTLMPTGIKVELIDKTGQWETIESQKQINWKGKVFWRGSYTTAANYYYSGAKFTLYFPVHQMVLLM